MTAVPGVVDDGGVGSRACKVIGSDSVDRFLERMSASPSLQERLRRSRHADAFLALAESSGRGAP
ncbi:MAG: Nif11-like leader peptide family natural product precursor [Cyanobium sp.]